MTDEQKRELAALKAAAAETTARIAALEAEVSDGDWIPPIYRRTVNVYPGGAYHKYASPPTVNEAVAAERKGNMGDYIYEGWKVEQAVAAERERCAQMAQKTRSQIDTMLFDLCDRIRNPRD